MNRFVPSLLLVFACGAQGLLAHAAVPRAPRDDTLARCSWDRPGRNSFTGDVVAAVDRYRDIPTPVREKLKQRMAARHYDDIVDIRRDAIEGKFQYAAAIRDMHFGKGTVCREVTRQRWTAKTHERGLVYCESEHCILVPTVCRNVSRVDRAPALVAGDRLPAPAAPLPGVPLASDGRETVAAAAPPVPADTSTTPPVPVASSFAETVAGAAVPLPASTSSTSEGTPFAGLFSAPGGPGEPAFPPVVFAPGSGGGGSGGSIVPIGSTPPGPADPGGGGGGGGGGTPVDPSPPPVTPIPEPSTWVGLLAGLALLLLVRRRQRRAT
jgi:hypothetical protein